MKHSTTSRKNGRRLWAAAVWLIAWQILATAVGQQILLASPIQTVLRFMALCRTVQFWQSILFTLSHILAGFGLALLTAILTATLSARFSLIEVLLAPPLAVIRAIPVASFVIVALIWVPSRRLSILISFLIALPILYSTMLDGLRAIDPALWEMAQVFEMPLINRLRGVVLPAVLPRLASALNIAIGLAWKSGVAAEVIGIPTGSIGEKLYKAKVYLATPDLFAWTATIVLASTLCERALSSLLKTAQRRLERM